MNYFWTFTIFFLSILFCKWRRDKISANRSLFYGCQRCWFSYDLWSCPCSNAKRWEIFCQYSTMQHWAFQSITLFPFPNQKRPFFILSVSDWLSWLRCYHMHGTLEVPIKAYLHQRHQHWTDEAQKAETVLSAVSYIYIFSFFAFCQMNFLCCLS